MHPRTLLSSVAVAVALGCEADSGSNYVLPEVAASSKYINLHVLTDEPVCMADKLAELDRFVDETAAFLGVPPPNERSALVLEPRETRDPETWPCTRLNGSCFVLDERSIFTDVTPYDWGDFATSQWHELTHAIDIPGNGPGHWILEEGIAEYLGSASSSADILAGFPERFLAIAAEADPVPDQYNVAMHFVGSLIERGGAQKYGELRRAVEPDAGIDNFATVYESIYGERLTDALQSMSAKAIVGRRLDTACEGEEAIWAGEPLTVELGGACGDGWFYGGLAANLVSGGTNDAKFAKFFVVDVPETGLYRLTVSGAEPTVFGVLRSCGDTLFGVLSSGATDALHAGRHELLLGFPAISDTAATVQLEYQGPLPSP